MSLMTIHISLDTYLAQWFVHDCGGGEPVTLIKGSIESKILEIYLTKRPVDVQPDLGGNGQIAIYIPTFRNRPPEYYNHLPKHAKAALIESIRNRFDIAMWNELHHFGKIDKRQDNLIYAFMEKHGIEQSEKNWNAIAKRYQRLRNVYLMRERAKKQYSRKKFD